MELLLQFVAGTAFKKLFDEIPYKRLLLLLLLQLKPLFSKKTELKY